ncbi:MAG TPA: DUF2169 domain-containing protein [Myxococcota bacterium]|jgi:hypothetical protein|nr:DUF2169 domain-containing protein [Myxococcota bacterium]
MLDLNGFYYMFLPYQSFDDGSLQFGVVCKRTYRIAHGERARADEAQLPLFTADVYWEETEPLLSSLKHEADNVPCKPKTDVVVNARAYAPGGQPVEQMTVAVDVEGVARKEILVVGDRFCTQPGGLTPSFSYPLPFDEMPLRYEYAYGGIDPEAAPGGGLPFPKNPVGTGFALGGPNAGPSVDGMPLPNLEDPRDRLTPERILVPHDRLLETPQPAGFGWYGKGWLPRAAKAGVPRASRALWAEAHDFAGIEARGGEVRELDAEFFNGASPGLVLPLLRGDEWLALHGMDRTGLCRFQLPCEGVRVALDLCKEGLRQVPMRLTTVAVLREEDRLYQCWSGSVSYASNETLWDKGIGKIVIEPVEVAAAPGA